MNIFKLFHIMFHLLVEDIVVDHHQIIITITIIITIIIDKRKIYAFNIR